jgi:hypothetical protein
MKHNKILTLFSFLLSLTLSGCASWPGVTMKLDMTSGPRLFIDFGMSPSLVLTNCDHIANLSNSPDTKIRDSPTRQQPP